jgi:hypothetical protein
VAESAVSNVYFGPGTTQYRSLPYSSGGGIAHYFAPTFAGTGASLEVHALGDSGNELGSKTFTLSSTLQGAAFLGETAGATFPNASGGFTAWIDSLIALGYGEPCGYIGYARTAAVTLGRGGIGPPIGGKTIFPPNGVVSNSQPYLLNPGDALSWCIVADSHGFDIMRAGAKGGTPVNFNSNPGANTQATATVAAPGAGYRNVLTSLIAKFVAGTSAPSAVNVNMNIIGGSSGGTPVWSVTCSLDATAGRDGGFVLDDLYVPVATNTALTVEFSGAGGSNTFESVSGTVLVEAG